MESEVDCAIDDRLKLLQRNQKFCLVIWPNLPLQVDFVAFFNRIFVLFYVGRTDLLTLVVGVGLSVFLLVHRVQKLYFFTLFKPLGCGLERLL
jgi:hypothetical protein